MLVVFSNNKRDGDGTGVFPLQRCHFGVCARQQEE